MGKVRRAGRSPATHSMHSALSALVELSRDAVKPPSEAQLERGLIELRERVAEVRSRGRAWRRMSLAGATAALLLVAGVWGVSVFRNGWTTSGPVAVDRIEGGALLDGGYLSESGHAGIGVFFNEGSSFVLAPGTRGRLREVFKDGARFAIEDGAASFQITPNAARRWSVEAGPFLVTVKGTVFKVAWDPSQRTLRTGSAPRSCGGQRAGRGRGHSSSRRAAPGHRSAQGGDPHHRGTIRGTVRRPASERGRPAERSVRGARGRRGAEREASRHADEPGRPRRHVSSPSGTAGRRWAELLAAGRWDRILADVDREGIDATLGSASSEDLLALADAARYRRRVDLARAALLAQRRRFPGSARALDALFLLGRVEELSPDGAARAIAFYDDYLARAPRGGYAAAALGRKMILTQRARRSEQGTADRRRVSASVPRRKLRGVGARAGPRAVGHRGSGLALSGLAGVTRLSVGGPPGRGHGDDRAPGLAVGRADRDSLAAARRDAVGGSGPS